MRSVVGTVENWDTWHFGVARLEGAMLTESATSGIVNIFCEEGMYRERDM